MAVQTLYDSGASYDIPATYDGAVYNAAVSDCVCKGVGDEFTLHTTSGSLQVSFTAGSEAVIGGGFFKVESETTVTLNANSTVYLCASINMGNANGSKGVFVQRASTAAIQKENLNGGGSQRDLLLYVITTNSSGVTTVVDKRVIKGDGTAAIADLNMTNLTIVSNGAIPVLTSAPNSAYTGSGKKVVYLASEPATKYSGYIYLIKE